LRAWGRTDECFSREAVDEYLTSFRDPACISATCEDYRAAASIDLQHDSEDEGRKVEAPILALWGTKGIVGKLYDVVALWQQRARQVLGQGLACGHFLPEEAPAETAEAIIRFSCA
jgi:haloacetate dehalogenase